MTVSAINVCLTWQENNFFSAVQKDIKEYFAIISAPGWKHIEITPNGNCQLVTADKENFGEEKWFCWFLSSLFLQIKPS